MLTQLLHDILKSRVYDVALETPLDPALLLSRRLANEILLKREDLQPVFSFKLRGAYNKIAHLREEERARGIITASAGNHSQGVAFSAKKLGLKATIVMPQTTPPIKVDAVRAMGGEPLAVAVLLAAARSQRTGWLRTGTQRSGRPGGPRNRRPGADGAGFRRRDPRLTEV